MKITKEQLKQIIKEELEAVMSEAVTDGQINFRRDLGTVAYLINNEKQTGIKDPRLYKAAVAFYDSGDTPAERRNEQAATSLALNLGQMVKMDPKELKQLIMRDVVKVREVGR